MKTLKVSFKALILISIFLIFSTSSKSQNIVGRWQGGTSKVSNEYQVNYQFYSNGTFIFNTGGDDGLTRVLKIMGTYKVIDNTIFFVVKKYVEITKGTLMFSSIVEHGTEMWGFDNTLLDTVKSAHVSEQKGIFKLYKKQNVMIAIIGGSRYYKVDNDPDKY